MANASGISWGVDVYRAIVFPLNADGSMQATDLTPYEGIQFEGSKAFDVTPAESRAVENYGDGRLRDVIHLAPNSSNKGELRTGYGNHALDGALTGVKVNIVGEASLLHVGTDQQGNEPIVSLLLMQLAHDENKLKRWRFYMVPRAQCIPMPSSYGENGTEKRYTISMSPSTVEIWGEKLTLAKHQCTESALVDGVAEGRPNIVGWMADGTETEYPFPAGKPAISTAKIALFEWATGLEITTGITKATTGITFTDAPPTGLIVAKYEW